VTLLKSGSVEVLLLLLLQLLLRQPYLSLLMLKSLQHSD
jgi:hypothetical protein